MDIITRESNNFSFLNYDSKDFKKIALQCSKIKLKEIKEPFSGIKTLHDFAKDVLDQSVQKEKTSNINLQFFIVGTLREDKRKDFFQKWRDTSQSFIENIRSLNTSLRITNIQNASPTIKNICRSLSHRFKIPSTCNMYVTPNKDFNCLGKHSDFNEIFILQLVGRKRWMVFQDEKSKDLLLNNDDKRKNDYHFHRDLELTPMDILYLPRNTVHKVECLENKPSIHLTFSLNLKTGKDMYHYLTGIIKEHMEQQHDLDRPINFQTLERIYHSFRLGISSFKDNSALEMYKNEKFIEAASIIKKGAHYY